MSNFKRFCALALIAVTAFTMAPFTGRDVNAAIISGTVRELPMAKEESVSTFLPSEGAPGQGLALNIKYPEKVRYEKGAPVVVVVPGGDGPNGLNFNAHNTQVGCVEIRFAFPGGGIKGFASSGTADYRGEKSQKALRDILLFAMGKLEDYKERKIKDLVPVPIAPHNVGILAWDNGGNIALVTMDKYSELLGEIGWIVFYECPLGTLFFPSCLGCTKDIVVNKHYRVGSAATGTCLIDFRKLAWVNDTRRDPGIHNKYSEPEPPGVLYFDDNASETWDESREYAFRFSLKAGSRKEYYSPEVIAAIERLHPFGGGKWPEQVATAEESEKYFQDRDGALVIPSVAVKYPKLLVTIFGGRMDHYQLQPDHPHIQLQYNTWLDSNAHWVRLNPDSIYLSDMANMNQRNFVNNKPNVNIESDSITDYLEPEGILDKFAFTEASVAELADRVQANNLTSPLTEPIFKYSNGVKRIEKTTEKPTQPGESDEAKSDESGQ